MKIRRTEFLFFYHTNGKFLDLKYGLHPPLLNNDQILVIPILYGKEVIIERNEFSQILNISTEEWIEESKTKIQKERLDEFISWGILLSDHNQNKRAELLLKRDEILKNENWNIYAALSHFMGKWKGLDGNLPMYFNPIPEDPIEEFEKHLSKIKNPQTSIPPEYHQIKNRKRPIKLLSSKNKLNENILLKRKTTRNFDSHRKLSFENFSELTQSVFGIIGEHKIKSKYTILKKNHPSGGALHSIEAYFLIINVEKLKPGVYHYQGKKNQLKPIKTFEREQAKDYALQIGCNQKYVADSSALVILTSRFYRSFFKYIRHPKMINYIHREAAHISQNFYLVCTDLGLGAFTTSMNDVDADEILEIDGFSEGSLVLLGCGHPIGESKTKTYPQLEF